MLRPCFRDGRPPISSDLSDAGYEVTEGVHVPLLADEYVEGVLLPVFCGERGLDIDLLFMMNSWSPLRCPAIAPGKQLVVRIRAGG